MDPDVIRTEIDETAGRISQILSWLEKRANHAARVTVRGAAVSMIFAGIVATVVLWRHQRRRAPR